MSDFYVEFDASDAIAALRRFHDATTAPLMGRLGALVKGQTQVRFQSETAPDGSGWAALSPSTIKAKGASGILKDTGRLMGSISYDADENSAVIGTPVNYAKYLQYGTKHMPARPFMGLASRDLHQVRTVVDAWARSTFN